MDPTIPDPFKDGSCIAFYMFDDNVNDYFGKYNLTRGTPNYVNGLYNKGLDTGSPNNGFNLTPNTEITFNGKYTITVWIKNATGSFQHYKPVCGRRYNDTYSSGNYDWFCGLYNDRVGFISYSTSQVVPDDGRYHFVAWIIDPFTHDIKFYYDENYIETANISRPNMDKINQVGQFTNFSSTYTRNIYIDHLRIFNRELTDDEIRLLYRIENPYNG